MSNIAAEGFSSTTKSRASYEPALAVDISEDSLARRFSRPLRQPQDVHFEFTNDPAMLHQYYRLREEMFISVWGLKHFSGQEDAFDAQSHIMVARKGLQCIGGGRLTVSTPQDHLMLPMEKEDLMLSALFPELDLHETVYGEFSRLAILPEFRSGAVFPELARRFITKAISLGVEYAFNIAPLPLARSYRQAVQMFGLKWDICHHAKVPQREEYEGIQMVISVMDLSLQVRNFKNARNERLAAASEGVIAD